MTKIATARWRHQLYFWGHLSKGLVYVTVGGLALATVVGQAHGGPEGPQQIVRYLRNEPGGSIILVALALGLFAYCAWRWYKAITDEGHDGTDGTGLLQRGAYAMSGTLYGLLGLYSITQVGSGGAEGNKQTLIVELMQKPFGVVVVGLLALSALYAAYLQFDRAYNDTFMEELDTDKMEEEERKTYRWLGKIGYGSRVFVYLILAYFLVQAVLARDPGQYKGIGGVLQFISQAAGGFFLAVVALGLLFYGAFVLVKSRYRELS